MSRIVFINIPAYGHINPTLGLVDELVKNNYEVLYFSTDEFRKSIEAAGGTFKSLGNIVTLPSMKKEGEEAFVMLNLILDSLEYLVDKILYEWKKKGINNKEDIEKDRKQFKKNNTKKTEMFDYDWLNDDTTNN